MKRPEAANDRNLKLWPALCLLLLAGLTPNSVFLFGVHSASTRLPQYINEYVVPTPDSAPLAITVDRNGIVWFSEHGGNSIAYVNPESQAMVEFPIPTGPISTSLWIALAPNGNVWFTEWDTNKIGMVHANLPIPVNVDSSKTQLRIPAGEKTSLSVLLKVSEPIEGNGTFKYSWASYNPADISVTSSSQYPAFSRMNDTQIQVQLTISNRIIPGNYTLGLGIDAGTVLTWTIIPTEVIPATSETKPFLGDSTILALMAILAAVLVVLLLRIRKSTPPAYTQS